MGNLIDTIGLREALRKTKSWCENKFAKQADFSEVSAQVTDNKSLLTEIKGTFTALQSGNSDVTKAQVATNTGRITQAESTLSDLSQQVSGKVGKSGSVEKVHQYVRHGNFDDGQNYDLGNDAWRSDWVVGNWTVADGWLNVVDSGGNENNLLLSENSRNLTLPSSTWMLMATIKNDSEHVLNVRPTIYDSNGTKYIGGGFIDPQSQITQSFIKTTDISMFGFPDFTRHQGYTHNAYYIKNIMLFNLTEMFGAGNEPTTAQAFAEALGYASIDDVPYIPYSASPLTLPNVDDVDGLMMRKLLASEVCLGEYTLKCKCGALVAVDSSGNETTLLGCARTMSLDDDASNSEIPNE